MSNLTLALSEVGRSQSFRLTMLALSRRHLWPRSEDSVWVWAAGGRPLGIASVRPRSGITSWELPHLFADADHGGPINDLLEAATRASAIKGAERVFLRVPAESDTVPVARRAGFFPGCRETLYRGRPYHSRVGGGLFDADSRLRMRLDEDDLDLFRMYNSATPVRVRQLAGMTLEQWRASRERHPRSPRGARPRDRRLRMRTAGDLPQLWYWRLGAVGPPRVRGPHPGRGGRRTEDPQPCQERLCHGAGIQPRDGPRSRRARIPCGRRLRDARQLHCPNGA